MSGSKLNQAAPIWVQIGTRVYDVGTMDHPGGRRILLSQANPVDWGWPADVTDTFRAIHGYSKKPHRLLVTLPSREVSEEELRLRAAHKPSEATMLKTFRRETQQLRIAGLFEHSIIHVAWRQLEILAWFVWASWCILVPGPLLGYWLGVLCMGVCFQRCGWLQHEFNHSSATRSPLIGRIMGSFWMGMESVSAAWWRQQHSRHHCSPQHLGFDPDINTAPLVAFNTESARAVRGGVWRFMLHFQAVTYEISAVTIALFWALWLHPLYIIRRRCWLDAAMLTLRYTIWFSVFGARFGVLGAFGLHLLTNAVHAMFLYTNFALSHTTFEPLPEQERESWPEKALRRTVDIHSHGHWLADALVDWWMGYLNYQVAHHLWPRMPQFRQGDPRVHASIRRIAASIPGGKYHVSGYPQALGNMFFNLHRVGNP
jgi:fatty acid desaturase